MNRKEKFLAFLEALRTDTNSYILDGVKQAFILTEAEDDVSDESTDSEGEIPEDAALENGETEMDVSFKVIPEMKAVESFAEENPEDVRKWIVNVLKPICKNVNAENAIAEGAEVDFNDKKNIDYEDDEDDDDDAYGGFVSNKIQKRKARQRRVAEKTN